MKLIYTLIVLLLPAIGMAQSQTGYERGERPQRCNGHVCPPYDCFPL